MNQFATMLLGVLAVAGCEASQSPIAPPAIRDSAGIRIIEHPGLSIATAPAWDITANPTVDFGGADGDRSHELFRVRSVSRLSTGELVVANGETREIRIFDATGKHLRTVGRRGSGPGEFDVLGWVAIADEDSLVAYESNYGRINVFERNGKFVRGFPLRVPTERFPEARMRLGDGSFLVASKRIYPRQTPSGIYRDTVTLHRLSAAGSLLPPIGRVPGSARLVLIEGATDRTADQAFGPRLEMASGDSLLYVGAGDRYEIRGYSFDGQVRLIIRVVSAPLAVTPAMIADFRTQAEGSTEPDPMWRDFNRRIAAAMQFPTTLPAHAAIRVDTEGNVWVEDYRADGESRSQWRIFGPDGMFRAISEMPAGFVPHRITPTEVAGTWTDESDVEHVRVYGLSRR